MPVIGGTVFDSAGVPVDRELRFYRRDTGAFLGRTRSSGGDGVPDPDFDKVSLLLHMDGADGSTAFTDSSPAPKTVTAGGNAKISMAQSKWGGTSLLLTGAGYLYSAPHMDFGFGVGDFTVECWMRSTVSDTVVLDVRTDGSPIPGVFIANHPSKGNGIAYYQSSTGVLGGSTATNDGNWHHYAWVRASGVLRMFSDGIKVYEGALASDFGSARPCWVGAQFGGASAFYTGHIDDLRITKGAARYTANFTPPAAPFPDMPSTGRTMPLGEYYFATNYTSEVQVVCVDDASEPLENDLILRTFPV